MRSFTIFLARPHIMANLQNNILLWTYTPSDGQQQKINSKVIGLTGSLIVINSRVLTDQMSFSYFVINYLNSS